jgi:glycerol-3-phosphate dehydrogenase
MRKFVSAIPFIVAALIAGAAAFGFAIAHEAHKAECNETAMNASKADIQAMDDGEAKTKAMKEMQMAEEMMAKKDMKACESHLHSAMEAIEE